MHACTHANTSSPKWPETTGGIQLLRLEYPPPLLTTTNHDITDDLLRAQTISTPTSSQFALLCSALSLESRPSHRQNTCIPPYLQIILGPAATRPCYQSVVSLCSPLTRPRLCVHYKYCHTTVNKKQNNTVLPPFRSSFLMPTLGR